MGLFGSYFFPKADFDTALAELSTLKNNEYKFAIWESIGATPGTVTKPVQSTILLDQIDGIDAIVETFNNGVPSGHSPTDASGNDIYVTSFDTDGNYTLSGTPSSFPVAIIYVAKIKAIYWQNVDLTKVLPSPEQVVNITQAEITGTAIDWDTADIRYKTLSGNTTFTFSNAGVRRNPLIVEITNPSTHTLTWPASVKWTGNTAPTQTTGNKVDVYTFVHVRGVTYGSVIQDFTP